MKKSVKILIGVFIFIIIAIGTYIVVDKFMLENKKVDLNENENNVVEVVVQNKVDNKEDNNIVNDTTSNNINQNTVENIAISNTTSTQSSSNNINKNIEIDLNNRFLALGYAPNFERISELTNEDLVSVAGAAIYSGFISVPNKVNDTNTEKLYSVEDIRGAVYAIFGKELTKDVSSGLLIFKDGKYVLNPADGDSIPSRAEIIEADAAAGTAYYTIDLYKKDVYENEEKDGQYLISISNINNMVTSKKIN